MPEQEDGASAEAVLARAMSPPHFPMNPQELRGTWSFQGIAGGRDCRAGGFTVLAREIPAQGRAHVRVSDERSALDAHLHARSPSDRVRRGTGRLWRVPRRQRSSSPKNANLLVHDAQLMPDELAAEQRFGHASVEYAGKLASHAGARCAVLFHHAPERTDDALDELAWSASPKSRR